MRRVQRPPALGHLLAGLLMAAFAALAPLAALAQAATPQTGAGPQALRDRYQALGAQLEHNVFGRKLALQSNEAADRLSGDIYAVIDHPFGDVARALQQPGVWCDILMLHLNTKHCAVQGGGKDTTVAVAVGRKFDQPLDSAQRIAFGYRVAAATSDYLDVRLDAAQGPMSTRNYRIVLEATPIEGRQTFIHLGYAYAYGTAARLAMKGYLATLGSDKIGFTTLPATGDGSGKPTPIGGVRGVVERNTMRYYLAIDSYLDAPATGQLDQRLAQWFDATERYAPQLHEVERSDYLQMKRAEFQRMASGTP
ncbi:hypothetical protein [Variovorax ginsengisoli]